ncbi:MAG: hypothetical protein FWC36_06415 [Spirochaetes bacterium]|nr:hypothetical protein [Spirochaetota bacterium]
MLSEVANINNHLEIILDIERPINSIGIGNTNGTYFTIIFDDNEELVLIL